MTTQRFDGVSGGARSPEHEKAEAIFRHFQREFSGDPVGAFARFFAKSGCRQCHGQGIETVLGSERTLGVAELRLCACARRRLERFVMKALLFESARDRGGLAFAEGTMCPEAELALPVASPGPATESAP